MKRLTMLPLTGWLMALTLVLVLAGCTSTRQATDSEYGDIRVGDIYELQNGATIIHCKQFTFWGFPGSGDKECLLPRGTNRPEGGEIAKSDLPGPINIRVYKIKSINAIDYVDQIVYVETIPGGKRYVARWAALDSLISRKSKGK